MEIYQLGYYLAEFRPMRTDNLKPYAPEIGKQAIYQASWIIEGGEFEGDWAMWYSELNEDYKKHPCWVPSSELKIISIA